MVSKTISGLILPVLILIFLDSGTEAASLRGEIIDVEELNLEPGTDADEYPDQAELFELGNDWTLDRKFKRQAPVAPGQSGKKLIRITPEKLKEILRILNKPKKSETLTLNGWSASGMPFNVLYTPNSLQQKLLSSNSARRYVPAPTPQLVTRENLMAERKDNRKENLPPGTQPTNKSLPLRKHYLVIPQLFLSYGWGSLGK